MQNEIYDGYSASGAVSQNTVLRKTYTLLGISFIPAVIGAVASTQMGFNIFALFGSP